MIKDAKIKPLKVCPYHLPGIDYATATKIPVSIEKRTDRITIILKGEESDKEQQLEIIKRELDGRGVREFKKLFNDVYELILKKGSIAAIDLIMRQLRRHSIITHHAYQPLGAKLNLYNLTDRIMIRFVADTTKDQIEELLDKYKLNEVRTSVSLNNTSKTVIAEVTSQSGASISSGMKPPKGKNPVKIANLLEDEPIVDTAEVSLIYRLPDPRGMYLAEKKEQEENITKIKKEKGIDIAIDSDDKIKIKKRGIDEKTDTFIPEDPLFDKQWYLHFHDEHDPNGNTIAQDANVNAVKAWKILKSGGEKEIVIAIIDSSIDPSHPDLINQLAEKIETIKEKFVFTSLSGFTDADLNDGDSHGTMCAGIALAERNEKGIAGIAWGCKFLPVWLDPNGGEELAMRCFEEVAKVAHVISFSRSPLPEHTKSKDIKSLLSDKLTEIARLGGPTRRGCVICVSAGNFQLPINGTVQSESEEYVYHLDLGQRQTINRGETIVNHYASSPGVIVVTASTSINTIARYNSFGQEVSVCAPSADWDPPEGMTKLKAGIFTTASRNGTVIEKDGGAYSDSFGGTSAAAPLVAGIAALVLSANDDLPADIVKKILEVTADKIDGDGKAKYNKKGHSQFYGYGKVNAAKAVELAISLKNKNGTKKLISPESYMEQIMEFIERK